MKLAEIIHTCFLRGSVRIETDQIYLAMTKDELVALLRTAESTGYWKGHRDGVDDAIFDMQYEDKY